MVKRTPEYERLYVAAFPLLEGEAIEILRMAADRDMEIGEFLTVLIRDGLTAAEKAEEAKNEPIRKTSREEQARHLTAMDEIYKTMPDTKPTDRVVLDEMDRHMAAVDEIYRDTGERYGRLRDEREYEHWINEGITRRARERLGMD